MITILCIKNTTNKAFDITPLIKLNMKLSKSIKNICWTLTFQITKNSTLEIDVGDVIILKENKKEVFSGVILTKEQETLSFKALDYAFYFNKNKETYQFVDVEASEVIKTLILSMKGKIGTIDSSNLMVDKFYFDKSIGSIISEIIDNIFSKEGKNYLFYYSDGKFNFVKAPKEKYKEGLLKPLSSIKGIHNSYNFNSLNYIEIPKKKTSIENLKNSVKVFIQKDKQYLKIDEKKDSNSIKKFGLMQEIIEIKEQDLDLAANKAENILKNLNKVSEQITIIIPIGGTISLLPGDILNLNYPEYNILGVYEIKNISYEINNTIKISLTCEKVN